MVAKLNLYEKLTINNQEYKIIGIDNYHLKNSLGKTKKWKSFTLKSGKSKLWFVVGIKRKPIVWYSVKKGFIKSVKNYKFNLEFSGIAEITFEGNKGFSSPKAEVILLEHKNKFFAIERFFDKVINTYYYKGELKK